MNIYKRIEFFVKREWKILLSSLAVGIFWIWAMSKVTALKLIPTVLLPEKLKHLVYEEPTASIIVIALSLLIGILIAIFRRRK